MEVKYNEILNINYELKLKINKIVEREKELQENYGLKVMKDIQDNLNVIEEKDRKIEV